MTIKYLEVDSTYRDRTMWPLPGNFQVLISQHSSQSASDPVSYSTPHTAWQSNSFTSSPGSTSITGTVISTGYGANTPYTLVISAPVGQLSTITNYYAHAVLSTAANLTTRILYYTYLGNGTAQIGISDPLLLTVGSMVTITDGTDLPMKSLFVPASPFIDNYYVNYILYDETVNAGVNISSFDSTTGSISLDEAIIGWNPTDCFSIRKQPPLLTGTVIGSASEINIGPLSNCNLVGSFIRIRPTYPAVAPGSEIRRIISYDTTTNIATVEPFTANPNGMSYEVLPYSYDNHTPFVYLGTVQQEFLNCSVKLLSLTLPSSTLSVGYGGTARDYPYFYVTLSSINNSTNNVSSSNNPHAVSTLFRATRKHSDEISSPFIHFTGDGACHCLKFNLGSNYNFKITLPNGEVFKTIQDDLKSPSQPNPLLQISALFEITR